MFVFDQDISKSFVQIWMKLYIHMQHGSGGSDEFLDEWEFKWWLVLILMDADQDHSPNYWLFITRFDPSLEWPPVTVSIMVR